jgi:medium-chain acyl-[acyl-carrier-protein] hydrolase
MDAIWEECFKVKSYEAEPSGKVRISTIFNYLQEVAGNQAEQLGVGFSEMQAKGLFWVLSRIKIVFHEIPVWGDEIKITTWPKGVDKFFALRDFSITNAAGKEIIVASTAWLVVDNQKFRLHKIESLDVPIPDNNGKSALHESLEKIKAFESEYKTNFIKVAFSDIDYVYHTNNTRYPAWIMDCYEPDFHKNNSVKAIHMNYLEQSYFNENIEIRSSIPEHQKTHYFEGLNEKSKSKIFQSIVEWQ